MKMLLEEGNLLSRFKMSMVEVSHFVVIIHSNLCIRFPPCPASECVANHLQCNYMKAERGNQCKLVFAVETIQYSAILHLMIHLQILSFQLNGPWIDRSQMGGNGVIGRNKILQFGGAGNFHNISIID